MKRKKSIKKNIQFSLLIFTLITLVLLWLFQIVFLDSYYEYMQRKTVVNAGNDIALHLNDTDFADYLTKICYKTDTSALVMSDNGVQVAYSDMQGKKSYIKNMRPRQLMATFNMVFSGQEDEYIMETPEGDAIVYVKGIDTINNGRCVIIINAQLEPVESTRGILTSQMAIISVALVLTSLVISSLLSNRVIRPIKNLSTETMRLAEGNYTADYSGEGLEETEELASALNYSAEGLSKVEDLRRELIANVSHDLKTPLTMIRAYSEMIRDITGENEEKRTEQLNVIINETERLTELVNDVIRVSRDEVEKEDIHIENINIVDMISSVTDRFSDTLKDYTIITEYAEKKNIMADRKATGQVLYNLISNAINYTGNDKKVIIKTVEKEEILRIEISDTGAGIPEDKIKLIWERYYRSNNTHSRPVAGSGLGLSIVKNALEKQHFKFGVESVVGKGSTFWFEAKIA